MASATSNLCEAANVVVQGNAQEEKLIAAAKGVAASTAQLLIACQVKADTNSESNRRLQVRGQGSGWVCDVLQSPLTLNIAYCTC